MEVMITAGSRPRAGRALALRLRGSGGVEPASAMSCPPLGRCAGGLRRSGWLGSRCQLHCQGRLRAARGRSGSWRTRHPPPPPRPRSAARAPTMTTRRRTARRAPPRSAAATPTRRWPARSACRLMSSSAAPLRGATPTAPPPSAPPTSSLSSPKTVTTLRQTSLRPRRSVQPHPYRVDLVVVN